MIKIKNLSVAFENTQIFDNADISFSKNKTGIILGSNGSGKTTLLKVLTGLKPSKNSKISIDTSEIFYLPQKINYPSGITLYDYLSSVFFKQMWKWRLDYEEKNKINKVLEDLEILNKKELLIENLSAGELQKANIALGLLSGAKLLLLDEPTSNMDLVNQIKTLDIIKKLNQKNITCVIVLHDLNLAAVYGDYFIGIAGNKEIISGNRSEFFKEEVLNKIYGINFEITKKDNDIHVQIVK